VRFTAGNAGNLPFPIRNFNACNAASDIRNGPRIDIALAEFFPRVVAWQPLSRPRIFQP